MNENVSQHAESAVLRGGLVAKFDADCNSALHTRIRQEMHQHNGF